MSSENEIEGTDGNDILTGTVNADRLDGDHGNDVLNAGAGNDRLKGDNGADTLTGGAGSDRFDFDADDSRANSLDVITDFVRGTDKIDLSDLGITSFSQIGVASSGGVTTVSVSSLGFQLSLTGAHALAATDFIFFGQSNSVGSSGNDSPSDWDDSFEDSINGSLGEDSISGDIDDDSIFGGGSLNSPNDGDDRIYGHHGHDRIYGNGGDDSIFGDDSFNDDSGYDDSIYGGMGDDSVYGSGGDDSISGNDGADLLCGGKNNDTITGGSGNDIFVFLSNGGYDLVLDLEESDIISIQSSTLNSFDDLTITQDANGAFISLGNGTGITFASPQSFDASDFFFWS
jgi:Ca2+-binding RTX toxin-like protein